MKKLILLIILVFPLLLKAHGTGPHGGTLVDIPPYHAEFQIEGGMIHIYIVDEQNKTLKPKEKGIKGKLTIQLSATEKKEVGLMSMGEALMADYTISDDIESVIMTANLEIEGKAYSARYIYEAPEKESSKFESQYKAVSVINGGTIKGQVLYKGEIPKFENIKPTKDQNVCKDIPNEALIVSQKGEIKNTVVYLEKINEGKKPNEKQTKIVVDQVKCLFSPRVQAGMVGANLTLKNSDPILHIVHGNLGGIHKGKDVINATTLPNNEKPFDMSLSEPGLIGMMCHSGHDWMEGYLYVFDHPYFSVTDENGMFEMTDIPEGSYTLKIWHEGWKNHGEHMEQSKEINVIKNQILNVDFQLN